MAEARKNQGNDEYRKKDFSKAIYFYTEGINLKCKDKELKAKLYYNRAIAHFYMGENCFCLILYFITSDLSRRKFSIYRCSRQGYYAIFLL